MILLNWIVGCELCAGATNFDTENVISFSSGNEYSCGELQTAAAYQRDGVGCDYSDAGNPWSDLEQFCCPDQTVDPPVDETPPRICYMAYMMAGTLIHLLGMRE